MIESVLWAPLVSPLGYCCKTLPFLDTNKARNFSHISMCAIFEFYRQWLKEERTHEAIYKSIPLIDPTSGIIGTQPLQHFIMEEILEGC
jgi:hypothetical protein